MLTTNVLRYGHAAALPTQRVLHAGPLRVVYEAGDLRSIQLGQHEIVRRIAVAVRDRSWATVPAQLANECVAATDDTFHITYDATHQQGEIDFVWRGSISGSADGTIQFAMDGTARASFLRNRIGFCVLHPPTLAGTACQITHVNGSVEDGTFPHLIAPQLIIDGGIQPVHPFAEMRGLTHAVVPNVDVTLRFDGDIFELEDQRNWTDGSFKTYGTPLRLPFPAVIEAGTRVQQAITLTLHDQRAATDTAPGIHENDVVVIDVQPAPCGPLPQIGLGMASHGQPLSATEIARLQVLRPAHLRVDLRLAERGYVSVLAQAADQSRALGVPLHVALFLADDAATALPQLRAVLDRMHAPVAAWLIFHEQEPVTAERWIILARAHLADYAPQVLFAAGTNAYFTDLNRARPPTDALDALTYSVNPQVHAVDNTSLAEAAAMIGVTVASARQFSGSTPLMISPVTLKPRFNPVASIPEPTPAPGALPPQVDPRQMSLFGACWTLASLKSVAESGARSTTYYETSGWCGVLERAVGSPLPAQFQSIPGAVFPLYHVLADVNEFAGGAVLPTRSSAPLRVDGLALRAGSRARLLLANMTNQAQRAQIYFIQQGARLRMLDERNAEAAMRDPEVFRADAGTVLQPVAGSVQIDLLPYAMLRMDMDG